MEAGTKKRWGPVVISVCLAALIGWMLFLKPSGQLSSLVPEHAAWYAEMENPEQILQDVQKGIFPYADSSLRILQSLREDLRFARSVFTRHEDLLATLRKQPFGVSAHALSEKETGYVFYLSCPEEQNEGLLRMLEEKFRNRPEFRYEQREYLGVKILEISNKKGKTFSLALMKSALAGSFSGFLLEEIIRNSGVFLKPGFVSRLRSDSRYQHMESKPVRLFINTGVLPVFLRQLLGLQEMELMRHAADAVLLGLDGIKEQEIQFDGYIINQNQGKAPKLQRRINVAAFVPEENLILSCAIRKKELWSALFNGNGEDDARLSLIQTALEDEMMLVLAQGQGLRKYDHLLIAPVKDEAVLQQVFQSAAGAKSPPYSYTEDYRGIPIFRHQESGFSRILGGTAFQNWSSSFYAVMGNCLLVSDQLDLLRLCADQHIEQQEEASPSGSESRWFDLYLKPAGMIPGLMENAKGNFRSAFRDWLPLFRAIRQIRISDSGEPENPGISLKSSLKIQSEKQDSLLPVAHLFLDSVIVTDPVGFGTGLYNQHTFWLMQDLKKQVHWLDANLSLKRTIPLTDFWIRPPMALRKGQEKEFPLLLTLPKTTIAFDASGSQIPDFNYQLPDSLSGLEHSVLIDYDHNFEYRLYLTGRHGIVLAADRSGRLLPGWNPKRLESSLALPPVHIRIAGRDYILLLDTRGSLMMTNRKGEIQPGFPIQLKGSDYSGWFLEPGLNEEGSFVYCFSRLGQMEKVNLLGVLVSSIQLFRPDVTTRFDLHPDQRGRSFVVSRQNKGSVTIFDQSYRPVFEHKSEGSRFAIRHFQFGGTNRIFAITDLDQKQCMLYNESGDRILKKPFRATAAAEINHLNKVDGSFRVLSVFENRVSLDEFYKD